MNKTIKLSIMFSIVFMIFSCSKSADNVGEVKNGNVEGKSTTEQIKNEEEKNPFIFVEGGTFMMGSNEESNEKPIHEVSVNDFYIGKYEITINDWYVFLKDIEKADFDKAKSLTNDNVKYDNNGDLQILSSKEVNDAQCAMHSVTWYGAVEYCNWLSKQVGLEECYTIKGKKVSCNFKANGFRLPTEAEWEYAARGGNKSQESKYSGGSNYLKIAWLEENSDNRIHKVGTKQPNELGIYDMSGNVWEWCNNWYGKYISNSQTNPTGPSTGYTRILRGGSWENNAKYCRIAYRIIYKSSDKDYYYGFRIVKATVNSKNTQDLIDAKNEEIRIEKETKQAKDKAYRKKILKKLKESMVLAQGGMFTRNGFNITLSDFYVGKYEITQVQYKVVMGSNPSRYKGNNNPVERVSWYDTVEFCNKLSEMEGFEKCYNINKNRKDSNNEAWCDDLKYTVSCDFDANGYRLPTEAEWEYAARGGNQSSGYKYSGSDNITEVAEYEGNNNKSTKSVGGKKPNELGIYDMSGNVYEWCWDWFDSYIDAPQSNPIGHLSGTRRIYRGGSWRYETMYCGVAYRNGNYPNNGFHYNGFRVARRP